MNHRSMLTALRRSLLVGVACLAPAAIAVGPEHNTELLDPAKDKPGLEVGTKAPALVLKDVNGKDVDLGELYKAKAPVVITFYRGGWCPFCNTALKAWGEKIAELESAGGTLIAITPETAEHAVATKDKIGWQYNALVDTDGSALRAFRVGFAGNERYAPMLGQRNAGGRNELPAPSTFIIDKDGVVRWAFNDWDYKKRADPDTVIAEVRKLAHGQH